MVHVGARGSGWRANRRVACVVSGAALLSAPAPPPAASDNARVVSRLRPAFLRPPRAPTPPRARSLPPRRMAASASPGITAERVAKEWEPVLSSFKFGWRPAPPRRPPLCCCRARALFPCLRHASPSHSPTPSYIGPLPPPPAPRPAHAQARRCAGPPSRPRCRPLAGETAAVRPGPPPPARPPARPRCAGGGAWSSMLLW